MWFVYKSFKRLVAALILLLLNSALMLMILSSFILLDYLSTVYNQVTEEFQNVNHFM